MNIEAIRYWMSEIEPICNGLEINSPYSLDRILKNMVGHLFAYDESEYPGKTRHDKYINSDKWKLRRKGFFVSDLWCNGLITCQLCGCSEKISENPNATGWSLHHQNYNHFAHKFFHEEMDDLTVLEIPCHETLHQCIDVVMKGAKRKIHKEHINQNGRFFDSEKRLKFGKYKGEKASQVPQYYLNWVANQTDSDYDLEIIENH